MRRAEHAGCSPLVVHASVHRVQHSGVMVAGGRTSGPAQLFPHILAVCELCVPGRNPHVQACAARHDMSTVADIEQSAARHCPTRGVGVVGVMGGSGVRVELGLG